MKYLALAALSLTFFLFAFKTSRVTADFRIEYLKKMQGTWFHEEDKSASVTVKGRILTFNYSKMKVTASDRYTMQITDSLPEYSAEKGRFLILSRNSDTLKYEILGLSDDILSLMHFPSGKKHLYRRK